MSLVVLHILCIVSEIKHDLSGLFTVLFSLASLGLRPLFVQFYPTEEWLTVLQNLSLKESVVLAILLLHGEMEDSNFFNWKGERRPLYFPVWLNSIKVQKNRFVLLNNNAFYFHALLIPFRTWFIFQIRNYTRCNQFCFSDESKPVKYITGWTKLIFSVLTGNGYLIMRWIISLIVKVLTILLTFWLLIFSYRTIC